MGPGADGPAEPALLRAIHHPNGISSVLELHGECDASNRGTLRDAISAALTNHPGALVIDISRLTFCDGGCARDLLAVATWRRVGMTEAHGTVGQVLELLDSQLNLRVDWAAQPLPTIPRDGEPHSPVSRDAPPRREAEQ